MKNQSGEMRICKDKVVCPTSIIALVEVTETEIRLLRTLNYDADNPIQGEEYSSSWTLSRKDASKLFKEKGFWETWSEINGRVCGGVNLYDGLSEKESSDFLGFGKVPFVREMDNGFAACWIKTAKPGEYILDF